MPKAHGYLTPASLLHVRDVLSATLAPRGSGRTWCTAALLGLVVSCAPHASEHNRGSTQSARVPPNGLAPDFELPTLDGGSLRLAAHLGKHVVLLDFWSTACGPCFVAMPHLDELYRRHRAQGLLVWGIAIDGPDSEAQIRADVVRLGVSFPILLDQETRVFAMYNLRAGVPYTVLIDSDGFVLSKWDGYTTSSGVAIEAEVLATLAQGR
jgi:peroxiredoxin